MNISSILCIRTRFRASAMRGTAFGCNLRTTIFDASFCIKNRVSRVVKQDSEKEIQAGHFQNQKQSACISRIQNNDGCGGNPNRHHSQADDRYGCICNHEFRFPDSYRFLFSALERKYKREFRHRLRQGSLKR